MSLTYLEEVHCPCGETFETELLQSISVQENPELKDLVLAGECNVVKCPSCFKMLYAERFLLYHDADEELMAFVYPKDMEPQRKEIEVGMGESFAKLQANLPADRKIGYQPFLLFGLDSLCALLKDEEELLDEAAIAQSLCDQLGLSWRKVPLDLARHRHIPKVLPLASGSNSGSESDPAHFREMLIAGLKRILEENPHLKRYRELLLDVEGRTDWSPA